MLFSETEVPKNYPKDLVALSSYNEDKTALCLYNGMTFLLQKQVGRKTLAFYINNTTGEGFLTFSNKEKLNQNFLIHAVTFLSQHNKRIENLISAAHRTLDHVAFTNFQEIPSHEGEITYIWGLPYRLEIQEGCLTESIYRTDPQSVIQVAVPEDKARYAQKYRALRAQGYYHVPAQNNMMRMMHGRLLLPSSCLYKSYKGFSAGEAARWDREILRWGYVNNNDAECLQRSRSFHEYVEAKRQQKRIDDQASRAKRVFAFDMERYQPLSNEVQWLEKQNLSLKDYWSYCQKEAIEGLVRISQGLQGKKVISDDFFVNPFQTTILNYCYDYVHSKEGARLLRSDIDKESSPEQATLWSTKISSCLATPCLGHYFSESANVLSSFIYDEAKAKACFYRNEENYLFQENYFEYNSEYLYGTLSLEPGQQRRLGCYACLAGPKRFKVEQENAHLVYEAWPSYSPVHEAMFISAEEFVPYKNVYLGGELTLCIGYKQAMFYDLQEKQQTTKTVIDRGLERLHIPQWKKLPKQRKLPLEKATAVLKVVVFIACGQTACTVHNHSLLQQFLHERAYLKQRPVKRTWRQHLADSVLVSDTAINTLINQEIAENSGLPHSFDYRENVRSFYGVEQQRVPYKIRRLRNLMPYLFDYKRSLQYLEWQIAQYQHHTISGPFFGEPQLQKGIVWTLCAGGEEIDPASVMTAYMSRHIPCEDKIDYEHYKSIAGPERQSVEELLKTIDENGKFLAYRLLDQERMLTEQVSYYHESLVQPGVLHVSLKGKYSEAKCRKAVTQYLEEELLRVLGKVIDQLQFDRQARAQVRRIFTSYTLMRRNIHKWGECFYYKGEVTVNPFFIHLPLHCLFALIAHEYIHLAHHSHSSEFKDALAHICPDHKEIDNDTIHFKSTFRLNRH